MLSTSKIQGEEILFPQRLVKKTTQPSVRASQFCHSFEMELPKYFHTRASERGPGRSLNTGKAKPHYNNSSGISSFNREPQSDHKSQKSKPKVHNSAYCVLKTGPHFTPNGKVCPVPFGPLEFIPPCHGAKLCWSQLSCRLPARSWGSLVSLRAGPGAHQGKLKSCSLP